MSVLTGAVDYWCNAFTPDRQAAWQQSIAEQGLSLAVTRPTDDFCTPADMVARMDETGFATLVLVGTDRPESGDDGFADVVLRAEELDELHAEAPSRFVATWSVDPTLGIAGVRRAREVLDRPWCMGLHTHTHSWDRPFDHADYYPYYALAADHDVPFVMQAGASGGRFASECGRPIGVDRPAIYFPDVRFVLSHTGWPWVDEAIAMAMKFDNVFLGTATWPPRRWSAELRAFMAGAGRGTCLFGTGFPTTGHHHGTSQLRELTDEAAFTADTVDALTRGTAHRVFTRLPSNREQP